MGLPPTPPKNLTPAQVFGLRVSALLASHRPHNVDFVPAPLALTPYLAYQGLRLTKYAIVFLLIFWKLDRSLEKGEAF